MDNILYEKLSLNACNFIYQTDSLHTQTLNIKICPKILNILYDERWLNKHKAMHAFSQILTTHRVSTYVVAVLSQYFRAFISTIYEKTERKKKQKLYDSKCGRMHEPRFTNHFIHKYRQIGQKQFGCVIFASVQWMANSDFFFCAAR